MQVSGLQVSLSIDMSGFITAMEYLIAAIETVADEYIAAAEHIAQPFSNATSAITEASSATEGFWDTFEKGISDLDVLKDITAIIRAIKESADDPTEFVDVALNIASLIRDWKKATQELTSVTNQSTQAFNNQGNAAAAAAKKGTTGTDGYTATFGSNSGSGGAGNPTPDLNSLFKEDFNKNLASIKSQMSGVNAAIKINGSLTAITAGEYDTFNKGLAQTTDNIGKQTGAIDGLTAAQKRAAAIAATLKEAMTTAFSDLGTILGNVMSGTKQNPFAMIAKQLGDAGKKFGEKLIAMGVASEWGLPGNPTGILEIAGGTALVAAGSAMSAIKMAAGGLVSGSSIVNVGEYTGASHNPEVIAPLDKLHSMLGGQTQNHTFEIQGDKLVSILQRVDNNTSYALGGA